jgi:hypothetical protein
MSMAGWQPIASVVIGILLLGGLIGYTSEEVFSDIPKPSADVCAVKSEPLAVPASGSMIDIDVTLTWSDSTIWLGIISAEEYEKMSKSVNVEGADVVACPNGNEITFIAGGPGSGDTFNWKPDGQDVHVMVGGPKGTGDGGDDDDNGLPPPFGGGGENDESGTPFSGYFDIQSSADISFGVLLLVILAAIEIGILATKIL